MNINTTTENGLCTGCGICKAVCPNDCVKKIYDKGKYGYLCDAEKCVNCGLCFTLCPGKGDSVVDEQMLEGHCEKALALKSRDKMIYDNAVSGGFVTETVRYLLDNKFYDCAFVIKDTCYSEQVYTEFVDNSKDIYIAQKSKYLQISQEKAVKYMLENRDKKIIFIGVPCFIHGLVKVMEKMNITRANHFLIGLFCDKTMTYNVIRYFEKMYKNKKITELYFRDKKAFGYPGGIRIVFEDGSEKIYHNTERMAVKDYFVPERCLYCWDKLNIMADVSVGDNYTSASNFFDKGSNSVILRTKEALKIWNDMSEYFDYQLSSIDEISKSQNLSAKKDNMKNAMIKSEKLPFDIYADLSLEITDEDRKKYETKINKLIMGEEYPKTDKTIKRTVNKKRFMAKMSRLLHRNS